MVKKLSQGERREKQKCTEMDVPQDCAHQPNENERCFRTAPDGEGHVRKGEEHFGWVQLASWGRSVRDKRGIAGGSRG